MKAPELELFKHQSLVLRTLFPPYEKIRYVFMIGGFGCGKSTTGVFYILQLVSLYWGHDLTLGIGGYSLKLLRETFLADLLRVFDRVKIPYKHNSQAGLITVGSITLVYLTVSDPESIFAHNFHGFVCDELDEIPGSKVPVVNLAIQERCRKMLPAVPRCPERSAPVLYLTTAQGLKGTYTLVREFKSKGVPYIKIRGRTQDNTTLDPEQWRTLEKLYTEPERKAFLEGEFVNLAVGRVYPEFDRSKHSYVQVVPKIDDVVICGQDFNAGFNACVCSVVRNGHIYIVDEFHWEVVGDAPRLLRMKYPMQRLVMTIDVNGTELLSAFRSEFTQYRVEVLLYKKVNPSISERILAVNKLCRLGRFHVSIHCEKLLQGLEVRGFDDEGNPEKGKGKYALDHHCDALEYMVWYIIHALEGFNEILSILKHDGRSLIDTAKGVL